MFGREKPEREQEEEKFIHRYFGPIVPIMAAAIHAVLHLDLPLGVAFAFLILIAASGVYLIGLLVVAFWRRRKLKGPSPAAATPRRSAWTRRGAGGSERR